MKYFYLILIGLFVVVDSFSNILMVTNTNDAGSGSLRDGVINAQAGDTVKFDPALMSNGSDTLKLLSPITINKSLVLKGAYNSTDTIVISGNNQNRIFWCDNFNNNFKLVVDSLVLINGYSNTVGGAIYCNGFSHSVTLKVLNSKIEKNNTDLSGAGIYSNSVQETSEVSIINSVVSKNSAAGIFGGGVLSYSRLSSAILNIHNSFFTNNLAGGSGGGMCAYSEQGSSIIFVDSSHIAFNQVTKTSSKGGGIFSYAYKASSVKISNSIISNNRTNTVSGLGGGCEVESATDSALVSVKSSTFFSNEGAEGGAVYCYSGSMTGSFSNVQILLSTFTLNKATRNGGAIYCKSLTSSISEIELINSTIFQNSANISGSGLYCISYTNTNSNPIIIQSSIIANSNSNIYNSNPNTINSLGYNILSDTSIVGSVATDQLNIDTSKIKLKPLMLNGGFTYTLQPDGGSPAIDNGNPNDISPAQDTVVFCIRDVGASEAITATTNYIDTIVSMGSIVNNIVCNSDTTFADTIYYSLSGCDSLITRYNVSITTSNIDELKASSFKVYPNPSNGKVFIEQTANQNTSLKLYDVNGKLVHQSNFTTQNFSIDIRHLRKGLYFAQFTQDDGLVSYQKIVLQ